MEGKVESGFSMSGGGSLNDMLDPGNIELSKLGQYELLDFADLARLCLEARATVGVGSW